jgi:serine/threonine-protein kinase
MPPPVATIELPERYRVDRHVANGGMAAVWLAQDTVLGRPVAVKLLAAHLAQDDGAVRRFMREARAAATLSSHPNVVTIFDVGEHAGRPFIVMEYLPGGSLAAELRRGRPSRADALRWLGEAASALDVAHERGIVHRDVKPGNLLLDERRRLAVADFGIARLAFETAVTQTGQVLGTAAYISPEQARGEPATAASDRYALAVVAYELLTGAKPFVADNFAAQARMHVEDPPPRVPGFPPAADAALRRALDKDPSRRWPTAERFVAELARAVEGTGDETEATRPLGAEAAAGAALGAAGAAAGAAAPRGGTTADALPSAPPSRRRLDRLRPAALGAAALLVGAAVALALLGGGEGGERARPADPARERPQPARDAGAERARRHGSGGASAAAGSGSVGAPTGESAASLNDRGFALMQAGRYGEAIPILQAAVQRCGASTELVCAYALYNLGRSLRLAGRPAEAIPVLERRLRYPNQRDVVAAELEAARRQAGRAGTDESGDDEGGKGKGRGRGKGEG